jgi:hypothetical protein
MGESADVAVVSVFCAAEDALELDGSLRPRALDVQASERRNLDGAATASWVVVATVLIESLPATLQALAGFLRRNQVEAIQVGELVIKNPRPEDVEAALRKMPDAESR